MNTEIFRRSVLKTTTFKHIFIPFLMPLLLFFIFYDYNFNSVVWCYLLLVVLIFLIALIFQLFYIVLEDNFFVIKNGICPFLHEKHFYKNVEKVNIKRPGGMAPPYIQVITKENRKHTWKYIIDLVAPKEYDKLVKAIKSKGVVVDNENLVNWN